MSAKVIIQPQDVWDFFQAHQGYLRSMMEEVAVDDETGVTVYVTEEAGMPDIVVHSDDVKIYSEQCVSRTDCTTTVSKIIFDYLGGGAASKVCAMNNREEEVAEEYDRYEIECEMDDREAALDSAVFVMLCDFLEMPLEEVCDSAQEADKIYDDIKDHLAEYLYRKWNISIRRPMYLETEDGEEFFEEYPYEHMEFDGKVDGID